MTAFIGRREFVTLIGGAAALPLAARAQQGERVRRIGVLLPAAPDDAEFQSWVGAFLRGSRNRAGSPAGIYGSKLGGLNLTPRTLANMRRNWWRSVRTSSWRPVPQRWDPCCD